MALDAVYLKVKPLILLTIPFHIYSTLDLCLCAQHNTVNEVSSKSLNRTKAKNSMFPYT